MSHPPPNPYGPQKEILMHSWRKTVLATVLLMALPTMVAGQRTITLRGGLSIASLGGDDAADVDSRNGLNIGAFFDLPMSDVLGVQLGAAYVQKGGVDTEAGVESELKLNYVELPLLLTISPAAGGNVGFDFFVGPVFSFNTNCEVANATQTFQCSNPLVGLDAKSNEWGAMVGAGLDYGISESVSLVLDVFYNYGFTKIDNSGVDDVKNRSFSIVAGVSFPAS